MNFESYTVHRFKIGIDYHQRVYQAEERGGLVYLRNVITGRYLISAVAPIEINVNGNPYTLRDLQDVVFNQSCTCEGEEDDSENKIFDLSFDKTFE